jgi:hypothetical protein
MYRRALKEKGISFATGGRLINKYWEMILAKNK